MTLRDIGAWFEDLWRSIQDGFHVAATQSFWDWPLWISIPLVIGVPVGALVVIGAGSKELREGEPDPLGWTIGFGILGALCALATFDLWFGSTVFEDGDPDVAWLRIGYPIATAFFGGYFLISVAKRYRK